MWGIDVSHWTKEPYGELYKKANFVITKLTNGAEEYKYESFGHECISKTLADGKLSGAYHYAKGGEPEAEAEIFCNAVAPYIGKILLALDWEKSTNSAWGDDTWVRKFIDAVYSRIHIYPVIYTGYEGAEQCRDCVDDCELWYARYRNDAQPEWNKAWKMGAWESCAIWQYTSSGGDQNIANITSDRWKEMCKPMGYATENAAIDAVIRLAEDEEGYLEKRTNSNLDSKTGNAGEKNFTKYGRDLAKWIGSPYANGVAWCDEFVDWLFVKLFGVNTAKAMLGGWSAYTPTSANYYKKMDRWSKTPKRGAQIFFENSVRIYHTGIVYKVTDSTVYTIEGNTSSAKGVVENGGCVRKKSYSRNSSSIAGYGMPNYSLVVRSGSSSGLSGCEASVKAFEEWANTQYPSTTKKAIGRLLNPTGKYSENDNDRLVALAIWKYIARDDFGAEVTPGNRVYGQTCEKVAKKMIIGYGYKEHPDLVKVLQGLLAGHGFYAGEIDGKPYLQTCQAIQDCEKKYGLSVDSSDAKKCEAGPEVWRKLLK